MLKTANKPGLEGRKQVALCRKIEESFANVPYPGGRNIAARGWGCDIETAREVQRALKGESWRDLLRKGIPWYRRHYNTLGALTPEAFHYYLPAFLTKVTRAGANSGLDLVPDWIVYYLLPPGEHEVEIKTLYLARVRKLNKAQRRAIIAFLDSLTGVWGKENPLTAEILRARRAMAQNWPAKSVKRGKGQTGDQCASGQASPPAALAPLRPPPARPTPILS